MWFEEQQVHHDYTVQCPNLHVGNRGARSPYFRAPTRMSAEKAAPRNLDQRTSSPGFSTPCIDNKPHGVYEESA